MRKRPLCDCEPVQGIAGQTPLEAGYFMPAEWAPHEATWLSWPKNPLTFPDDRREKVEIVYGEMVRALSSGEMVRILVDDQELQDRAEAVLRAAGVNWTNVTFVQLKSADVWMRDYGPTYLLSKDGRRKAATKWNFNAWGGKYDDLIYDDITGIEVVAWSKVRTFLPGIVMEGGSIDVNGLGTVLTTEQCLLNKNRNPDLTREDLEGYLEHFIGAPHVIWLKSGIDGDDTDGHVDDFARFVGPRTVLCAWSESDVGENKQVLDRNLDILQGATDQYGGVLEVVKLPMPRPIELPEEERFLPASYANFYIGNKAALLPVFGDENDKKAQDILASYFPGREIVPIMAADLVYGYGGFHCVTQQDPAVKE